MTKSCGKLFGVWEDIKSLSISKWGSKSQFYDWEHWNLERLEGLSWCTAREWQEEANSIFQCPVWWNFYLICLCGWINLSVFTYTLYRHSSLPLQEGIGKVCKMPKNRWTFWIHGTLYGGVPYWLSFGN